MWSDSTRLKNEVFLDDTHTHITCVVEIEGFSQFKFICGLIQYILYREVGGWSRAPKNCTGRDWGMGSSTI